MAKQHHDKLVAIMSEEFQRVRQVDFGAIVETVTRSGSGQITRMTARVQGASGTPVLVNMNAADMMTGQVIIVENLGSATAPVWAVSAIGAIGAVAAPPAESIGGAVRIAKAVTVSDGQIEIADSRGNVARITPNTIGTSSELSVARAEFATQPWMLHFTGETFDNSDGRDFDALPAIVEHGECRAARNGAPSSFTSKVCTGLSVVTRGTTTDCGDGYIEDENGRWCDGDFGGYTLEDAAGQEFGVYGSTHKPRRLIVRGSPACGPYTVSAPLSDTVFIWCGYRGRGIKLEASLDRGLHWTKVLDTADGTNYLRFPLRLDSTGELVWALSFDADSDASVQYVAVATGSN